MGGPRPRRGTCFSTLVAAASVLASLVSSLAAQTALQVPSAPDVDVRPNQIKGLEVDEHLGAPLPLELSFTNAQGELVPLETYFKGDKPAVMAMVYYDCPIVCDVLMEKLNDAFAKLDLTIGKDFNVLLFSFDPSETTVSAKRTKDRFVESYARANSPELEAAVAKGWEFHTSDITSARLLANAVGFKYRRMESGEYSHPVATFLITPTGKVSRYIHGFDVNARDLKLSLLHASEGKIDASIGDRLMAFCYMYDPKAGSYSLQAFRVMQVAGVLTMLGLGTVIGLLFAGERARRRFAAAKPVRRAPGDMPQDGSGDTRPDGTGDTSPRSLAGPTAAPTPAPQIITVSPVYAAPKAQPLSTTGSPA